MEFMNVEKIETVKTLVSSFITHGTSSSASTRAAACSYCFSFGHGRCYHSKEFERKRIRREDFKPD